jgi:hypothetical protein
VHLLSSHLLSYLLPLLHCPYILSLLHFFSFLLTSFSFLLLLLYFHSFLPCLCRLLECVHYIQRGLELWNDVLKVPIIFLLLCCIAILLCKSSNLFYAHYCECQLNIAARVILLFVLSSTARFCLHMGTYFYPFSLNNHKIHSSRPPIILPVQFSVPHTSLLLSLTLTLTLTRIIDD